MPVPEPLTSLMIRELSILARDFGRASRGFTEMARALREHLRPDLESDKMAINTGRSGAEKSRASGEAPLLPGLEEPASIRKEYD